MSTSTPAQEAPFAGNKGFHLATPATLVARLIQYQALANDVSTPATLRDYSQAAANEIRAELTRRAPSVEAA